MASPEGVSQQELRPARLFPRELAEAAEGIRGVLGILVSAADSMNDHVREHSERVAELTVQAGHRFGLSAADLDDLYLLGILHDVGKCGTDPAILSKPGALAPAELRQMQLHPAAGAELVARIPTLAHLCEPIRHHHERVDGSGYPDGLGGEELDLHTHILIVCDAYEAMTCARPYRPAMSVQRAADELIACAGSQFHGEVVSALLESLSIRERAVA